MFRIGFKLSSNPHNRIYKIKKNGYSRLYSDIKCREIQQPCIHRENRLYREIKMLNQSRAEYSTENERSGKSRGGGAFILTLGTITLGTIGILTLAKNNSGIRDTLEEWIPGTDKTIRIIFQEDGSYFDKIFDSINSFKQSIMVTIFGDEKREMANENTSKTSITSDIKQGQTKKISINNDINEYKPPKSTFEPLIDRKQPPVNESYAEIRETKNKSEKIDVVVEKPTVPVKKIPDELKPRNLVELEKRCGDAATKAINAYQDAINAIKHYNQDVVKVIDNSGPPANVSSPIWLRLKEATEKRKRAVKQAEDNAIDALQSLKQLSKVIDDSELDATPAMKATARRNVKKLISNIDDAKDKYENEDRSANITENYWNKVKLARENFNEELQILFPNININDKHFSVNEELFDLFVLHMYNKVMYLQTELQKLETIGNAKLKAALKLSGDITNDEKINQLVNLEMKNEKRLLQDEFERKLLAERKLFEEELRKQLKLQAQINADQTKEMVETKERELQRVLSRTLDEQLEAESNKYKAQLAVIVGRLRGLDEALKLRLSEEKGACDAQILWAACQALARAIKVSSPGMSSDKSIRPLDAEIKAVAKVAPKDDALVQASLAAIPEEAVKRGVFPEDALRKRFLKVEDMARRLALVPEEGGSLPIYLLSYLQNFLLIKSVNPIRKSEIDDEPTDMSKLDTYDILNRARYWIDRGDFKMTLRYMNLLKGAPKSIAKDWINETRILLETQQAVDTLIAYAGAIGLVFLGSGDSKEKAQN